MRGASSTSGRRPRHAYATLSDDELAEQHRRRRLRRPGGARARARRRCARVRPPRGLRLARQTGQSPFIPGPARARGQRAVHEGDGSPRPSAVAETATDAAMLTGNDQFAMWALWADAMACSCAGDTGRALASAREAAARAGAIDRDLLLEPVAAASRRRAERGRRRGRRSRRAGRVRGRARTSSCSTFAAVTAGSC